MVHDFFPGEYQDRPVLPHLTRLGSVLFFVADDLETGYNVWRTDGTPTGTHRVSITGFSGETGGTLQLLGRRVLWVAAEDGSNRRFLFSATEQGSGVLLHTIGAKDSSVDVPVEIVGGRLFFQDCVDSGCSIWSSDGTTAGTQRVRALAEHFTAADQHFAGTFADRWLIFQSGPALFSYDVRRDRVVTLMEGGARWVWVYPVGDSLFLHTAHELRRGRYWEKLWVSRLSSPRAQQLFGDRYLEIAGWLGNKLYFISENERLWSTDGRRESTRSYSGDRLEPDSVMADRLGSLGSTTFIPVPGYYWGGLYGTDEDRHDVRELYHTCSRKYECLGFFMSTATTAGDRAFVSIRSRLLVSDGTPRGTKRLEALKYPDETTFRVVDERLVLGAFSPEGEQQLWETDGTESGTRALSDGTLDRPFRVQGPPMPFAGALFVAADRKPIGQQLWRIADGKTTPVTGLRHLPAGITPNVVIPLGDRLVLQGGFTTWQWLGLAPDSSTEPLPVNVGDCALFYPCTNPLAVSEKRILFVTSDRQLWSTDGTAAGSFRIPLKPKEGEDKEENSSGAASMGAWGDRALVLGTDGGLWTSDGSAVGARFIAQLPEDHVLLGREDPVGSPLALGPLAFLFRRIPTDVNNGAALELWRTDGTVAGTLLLASLSIPEGFTVFPNSVTVGGRLFFRFRGTLWTSDGSPEGTQPMKSQPPGGTFALAAGTTTLYAAAGAAADGQQTLWAIDPETLEASHLGTFPRIADGYVGTTLGSILGDTLFFRTTDAQEVERWWVTEGTPPSTHVLPEPLASDRTVEFTNAADRRYFTACETEHGCELWSTDRLGEDTRMVEDLWPGPRGSYPEVLAVTESSIWFAATEPSVGRELWRLDLSAGQTIHTKTVVQSRPIYSPARDRWTRWHGGGEPHQRRRRERRWL